MMQTTSPTLSVWNTKSADVAEAVSVPFTFAADFSVRPAAPSVSVGPHFTPKKRGRPPKASPFLDLEFGGSNKTSKEGSNDTKRAKTDDCKDNAAYSTFPSSGSCSDISDDLKTDDVFIGAYLLSQLCNRSVPTCVNCNTRRTPLWRKGWRDGILKRDVLLCNACGLKYSKRQYCCYCKFIYNMKEDVLSQQSNWMDCDSCKRWVHIDCELRYGTTFTFDGRKYHGPAKYFCPDCQQEQKLQAQLQLQPQLLPKPQQQQLPTQPSTSPQGMQPQQQTPHLQPPSPFMPTGQALPLTLPLPLPSLQQQQSSQTMFAFKPTSTPTSTSASNLSLPNIAFAQTSPFAPKPYTTTNNINHSSSPLLPSYDKFSPHFFPPPTNLPPPTTMHFSPPFGGQGSFMTAVAPKPEPMAF